VGMDNTFSRWWSALSFVSLLCMVGPGAHAQPAYPETKSGGQASPAIQPVRAPTWGLHGMVLFGGSDGLFASHLPMFHSPHDYHVVIALQVASPEVDAAMRARLARAPALWTLVPEKFELVRLAPNAANPLTEFKADIVEGHFERGGKAVYSNVTVHILRTERFVRIDPNAQSSTSARYLPIGRGHTWFLVKEVRARPDFDHVVMLSTTHPPAAITVSVHGVARPADSAITALLSPRESVIGTVYYDTEDLQ